MNKCIDNLTFGEIKELMNLFGSPRTPQHGLSDMVGEKCIVRTYSAGVWFGTIDKKAGNEVIVTDARRLWRWHTTDSISLSAVALTGINESKSRVAEAVDSIWLEAIEIIPCSHSAIKSIEGAKNAKSE